MKISLPPIIPLFFSGLFLASCSGDVQTETNTIAPSSSQSTLSQEAADLPEQESFKNTKTIGGFEYRVSVMNMLEFLDRKGETPAPEDRVSLQKQSLLFLEIASNDPGSIFDSKDIIMSREDISRYLMAEVKSDITVQQAQKRLSCVDVLYEGQWGKSNALRVAFLIDKPEPGVPCQITYYDRITGNGLIKFSIKNN